MSSPINFDIVRYLSLFVVILSFDVRVIFAQPSMLSNRYIATIDRLADRRPRELPESVMAGKSSVIPSRLIADQIGPLTITNRSMIVMDDWTILPMTMTGKPLECGFPATLPSFTHRKEWLSSVDHTPAPFFADGLENSVIRFAPTGINRRRDAVMMDSLIFSTGSAGSPPEAPNARPSNLTTSHWLSGDVPLIATSIPMIVQTYDLDRVGFFETAPYRPVIAFASIVVMLGVVMKVQQRWQRPTSAIGPWPSNHPNSFDLLPATPIPTHRRRAIWTDDQKSVIRAEY